MLKLIESYGLRQGWTRQDRCDRDYRALRNMALFAGPDPEGVMWKADDGYVPLSLEMMAKVIGDSRPTVRKAITDLEDIGSASELRARTYRCAFGRRTAKGSVMEATVTSIIATKRNGPLIAAAAQLWIKPEEVVLDNAWGRGLFWTDYHHPGPFIIHDKYTVDGVDFRQLPEADESIDVVVFDPPYVAKGGRTTSGIGEFDDRYGIGGDDEFHTPQELLENLIAPGMKEAVRVLKPKGRLFVKTMDYVSSGKLVLGRHFVVTTALSLGLEQVDEFVHYSGTGPQPKHNLDGTLRRQVHSRRAHSFLCVFRRPPARRRGA